MTDLICIIVCLVLVALFGFIAFELITAVGAWILNIIDLSN